MLAEAEWVLRSRYRFGKARIAGTTSRQVVSLPTDPPTVLATVITEPLELDSYYGIDLYADVGNEHWTVRAYARNVTDERGYYTAARVASALTGAVDRLVAAPTQPRTIGIEVDYRF